MKRLIAAIAALIALFALAQLTVFIVNDRIAAGLERRLLSAALPQDARIIGSKSTAGKKLGNGNGMQRFGAMLVESGLGDYELVRLYEDEQTLDARSEDTLQRVRMTGINIAARSARP